MSNPFTKLGSYIGFLVGLVMDYLLFGFLYYLAESGKFEPWGIMVIITPPIAGFMIGWKIHETINKKKTKKKK